MAAAIQKDLDFLGARLHARRSRLAEGARLDELARLRTVAELAHRFFPRAGPLTTAQFQRALVRERAGELVEWAGEIGGAGGRLLEWMRMRFQVENLKVLARGWVARAPVEDVMDYLVPLGQDATLDARALVTAATAEDFAQGIPDVHLREGFETAGLPQESEAQPFFREAGLDRAYLRELLHRAARIPGQDRLFVQSVARQEVDIFHLNLVSRGRFTYRFPPASLSAFHVKDAGIRKNLFVDMLSAPDLAAAARPAVGKALDRLPSTVDAGGLEAMAWGRFLRLANLAFRQSHMGMGAVAGYAGLRRVELSNLITLSEGIRAGLEPAMMRGGFLPRTREEAVRV